MRNAGWGLGRRRMLALLVAVALSTGTGLPLGRAAVAAPPAPAASPPSCIPHSAFRIQVSGAKPEFPNRITFTLAAEADADIVAVQLFYRPALADVTNQVTPEFTPGRRVEIAQAVDMRGPRYLPPGLDLQFSWALTDAAGNHIETAPAVFVYQDERFSWRTKTAGQVTVFYYSGNDSFGQELLDTATRTIDRLRRSFGVTGDRPIHIVVYGNSRDFAASLPPNSAEWIGGQAHPDLGLIVTGIQPGSGATAEMRRVIPHEISHQLLYQATNNPYGGPAHWLDEGLAVYNQETKEPTLGSLLGRAVKSGTLLPVRALNSNFPLDREQALLSYAESLSLVEYLIGKYGEAKLGELLVSFRAELAYDEALRRTLGIDTDTLDREWKDSLGYKGDAPGAVAGGAGAGSNIVGEWGRAPGVLPPFALPAAALTMIAAVGYALRRRRPAGAGGAD